MRPGMLKVIVLIVMVCPAAVQAATPLVSWDCALPAGVTAGETVDLAGAAFHGTGSLDALNSIRILPPADNSRAAACRAFWTKTDGGGTALSLAATMARSIFAPAERAGVVQFGTTLPEPVPLKEFSLLIRFKLTGGMCFGGGNPPFELDGTLVRVAPGLTIGLTGKGRDGRQLRRPVITIEKGPALVAAAEGEITVGEWRTLLVTRAAGQAPTLWLDGRQVAIGKKDQSGIPEQVVVNGPVTIGGDRSWGNVPIELGAFSFFGEAQTWDQATAAITDPACRRLNELNTAPAWTATGAGVEVQDDAGKGMVVKFDAPAVGTMPRVALKVPVELGNAQAVQFWYCMPMLPGGDFGHKIQAVLADDKGKETICYVGDCISTHITTAASARRTGLWTLANLTIPRGKGLRRLVALQFTYEVFGGGKWRNPSVLHFRNFVLESIDYSRAGLYYVVGNMSGNFYDAAFNSNRSRAMTDVTGETRFPYLLLDNAVDQAFSGRPEVLDLALEAYDSADTLLWTSRATAVPARSADDFFRKIEVPLTAPGTYRVKAKSYDNETGRYFSTLWSRLVVIRGAPNRLPALAGRPVLQVNPDQPFGMIAKDGKRQVEVVIGAAPGEGKLELKYAVIPYSQFIPGRAPVRPETMPTTVPAKAGTTVTVPLERKSCVGLVMAELWLDGFRVDREERLVGVENRLDAPLSKGGPAGEVLNLKRAGPDGIWSNSQFHGLMDFSGEKPFELFEKSLDEARKISPYVGISLQIERFEPLPGVYDWDYLARFFDTAAAHGCKVVLYMAQKYPPSWAPVDFYENENGRIHNTGIIWSYLVGGVNYATGKNCPGIIKDFNVQLARRFAAHPGFGAYYFESEHLVSDGSTSIPGSHDPGNRQAFSEFLQTRYRSIAELNARYGTRHASFADVPIPASDVTKFPRKIMHADLAEYQMWAAERFTLQSQFDAVRREDPVRPIIVYHIGVTSIPASAAFYKRIASAGGIMANGGVHSTIDHNTAREAFQSIPGLRERMEPHDMYHYQPMDNGLDEMVFGMLALGGRGMNFHYFIQSLPERLFSADKLNADKTSGVAAITLRQETFKALARTEKVHDQFGIMNLRHAHNYCLSFWTPGIRPIMTAFFVNRHVEPLIHHPNLELTHLDPARVIILVGELIDNKEIVYLRDFLARGGKVVLDESAAAMLLSNPDDTTVGHALLAALGIDPGARGQTVDSITVEHDRYQVGKGEVLVFRQRMQDGGRWSTVAPAILKWSGVEATRLADSDDPYMQMHLLRAPDADYLAVTHRGIDQNAYNGPREWSGKIRYCAGIKGARYEVDEIWTTGQPVRVGVMDATALATGFDAGAFTEMQMKVYRIREGEIAPNSSTDR